MSRAKVDHIECKWNPVTGKGELTLPLKWKKSRKRRLVTVEDVFVPQATDGLIDRVFAHIASGGGDQFRMRTENPARMASWFASVKARGPAAMEKDRQERRLNRLSWEKEQSYGHHTWSEWDILPTPELKAIYDSAAQQEWNEAPRDRVPSFSGGEYSRRDWPLNNLWIDAAVVEIPAPGDVAALNDLMAATKIEAALLRHELDGLRSAVRLEIGGLEDDPDRVPHTDRCKTDNCDFMCPIKRMKAVLTLLPKTEHIIVEATDPLPRTP